MITSIVASWDAGLRPALERDPPFNDDPPAVKALAGYVEVDGGSVVEYALVLNGPTISDQSEYRPVWNALADVLVTYPSGPTPAELGLR